MLSHDELKHAYNRMCASINTTDTTQVELFNDVLNACHEYAYIRSRWETFTIEQKIYNDDTRTNKHNMVIMSLDILVRYMKTRDYDTSWRALIGEDHIGKPRKDQGDFACYIAYHNGIKNR